MFCADKIFNRDSMLPGRLWYSPERCRTECGIRPGWSGMRRNAAGLQPNPPHSGAARYSTMESRAIFWYSSGLEMFRSSAAFVLFPPAASSA